MESHGILTGHKCTNPGRCTPIENNQLNMTAELQAGIFVEVLYVTLPKPVGCTDKKEV